MPRADSRGPWRALEWALTAVALPILFLGLLPFAFRPRLWRGLRFGEWGLTFISAAGGALTLPSLIRLSPLSPDASWIVTGVGVGALFLRAALRSVARRS